MSDHRTPQETLIRSTRRRQLRPRVRVERSDGSVRLWKKRKSEL